MKFRACSFEWFALSDMYIQFACWAVIWDYMAEFYKIQNPSTPFICCVHCCGVGVVKRNRTKFYFQNLLSNWVLPVRKHCLGTENGMTKKLQTKKKNNKINGSMTSTCGALEIPDGGKMSN